MSTGFAPGRSPDAVRPKLLEAPAVSQLLQACLSGIKDPRVERSRLHQLSDILTIAILAVLAGGNGWEDMEVYGLSKQAGAIDISIFAQRHSECGHVSTCVRAD